jgi:hypothetical protein
MRDEKSSLPASAFLWFAVGLMVISQLFGVSDDQPARAWILNGFLRSFVDLWESVTSGRFSLVLMVHLSIAIAIFIVLVTTPWLVGLLSRAGPLLFVLRYFTTGFTAYGLWKVRIAIDWFRPIGVDDVFASVPLLSGFWIYLLAILMNAIGLWLIPRARKVA